MPLDLDLAAVGPCPNCGTPTRRFASVPIAGSGTSLVFADSAWCRACIQAKCDTAVRDAGIEQPRPTVDVGELW